MPYNVLFIGTIAVLLILFPTTILFALAWWRSRAETLRLRGRYGGIEDVQAEQDRIKSESIRISDEILSHRSKLDAERSVFMQEVHAETERLKGENSKLSVEIQSRRSAFETKFAEAKSDLKRLSDEVKIYEERADLQSFGLYQPRYSFDASERYKAQLDKVWAEQAQMLKDKVAATCHIEWKVDGSAQKGRVMIDRQLKLLLRAFNGECDAAIAKVRFNNAASTEERIKKSFEAINKLGEPNHCVIASRYLGLKLAELHLTHELAEKIQAEREEQREVREQMKEEEAAMRELERVQKEAEQEERRYQQALAKAKADMEGLDGKKQAAMAAKIAELEGRLAEAHTRKERATSQAQLTRAGHIYVISNHGSFGDNVFKIGMTRRLDPMDRVRELGDASVPFTFDVHAIIYTDDAPRLESTLHKILDHRRVNMVNPRKEFFHISVDEVEEIVRTHCNNDVTFTRLAVAEEYRKSIAIREEKKSNKYTDNSMADHGKNKFDHVKFLTEA